MISDKGMRCLSKSRQLSTIRHPSRSEPSLTPLWEPQLSDQSNVGLFKEFYQTHAIRPINVKLRFVPFPKHSPTEHSMLMPIRNRGRHSIL